MPDTATLVPADVELLAMLRAARLEGLPCPTGATVDWRHQIHLHVSSEADSAAWQEWWTRHGADSWEARVTTLDQPELGRLTVHHSAIGQWRGHSVTILHIDLHKLEVPA